MSEPRQIVVESFRAPFAEGESGYHERVVFHAICPRCGRVADWVRVHQDGREPKRYEAMHDGTSVCAGNVPVSH